MALLLCSQPSPFVSLKPTPSPLVTSLCRRSPLLNRKIQLKRENLVQNPILCVQNNKASTEMIKIKEEIEDKEMNNKLKIGIVGFGNFGQFLAKTLVSQGHHVLSHSRSHYSDVATPMGVSFFSDAHEFCEQNPDVVIFSTSILSMQSVLQAFPFNALGKSTLFVDVLSVKEFPKNLFLQFVSPDSDVLCTHPMFGPQSGKDSWKDLNFVYDKVRINDEERCCRFLDVFSQEGCSMVEMSCREHDKCAAESQFITHLVGRGLEQMSLESTPINTKGYESLLDLVKNTSGDSFDLFLGLFMHNRNALEQLERMVMAFEYVKKQIFGELHAFLRKQLFGTEELLCLPSPLSNQRLSQLKREKLVQNPLLCVQNNKTNAEITKIKEDIEEDKKIKLKIGIVGFGNFGQFLAKTLVSQGHCVLAHSRSDYSKVAKPMGVSFFSDAYEFCEQNPDVVIVSTSILSMRSVLQAFPFHALEKSTLFVDVLSVKEFPKNLFLQFLPQDSDILCTHPMFGPQSGKESWKDLNFVYDKVRVSDEDRCSRFLNVFSQEGCSMVEMSCHEHDKWAAESQLITHLVGRVLERLSLESTPINTKGYESLLDLVKNTSGNSFDLFLGLFMHNRNAFEILERMVLAFEAVKKQLFGELHAVLRKQLFGTEEL